MEGRLMCFPSKSLLCRKDLICQNCEESPSFNFFPAISIHSPIGIQIKEMQYLYLSSLSFCKFPSIQIYSVIDWEY